MLEIKVDDRELFDEKTERFYYLKGTVLKLEHSLISISKWESKWKKPFLDYKEKSNEELIDYIRCMTMNTNVDESTYMGLTEANCAEVSHYINDEMTATWFNDKVPGIGRPENKGQVVTSELIYYWMIVYNIPSEYQKWHLNRLLTLIRICEIKNKPSKKMSRKSILASNRSLNEARKKAMGTRG